MTSTGEPANVPPESSRPTGGSSRGGWFKTALALPLGCLMFVVPILIGLLFWPVALLLAVLSQARGWWWRDLYLGSWFALWMLRTWEVSVAPHVASVGGRTIGRRIRYPVDHQPVIRLMRGAVVVGWVGALLASPAFHEWQNGIGWPDLADGPASEIGWALVGGSVVGVLISLSEAHRDQIRAAQELRRWVSAKSTDLRGVDLTGADLRKIDLRGRDLSEADLSHADLRGALLNGALLRSVLLFGTVLENADLSGADLSEATVGWKTYLHGALFDTSTTWPDTYEAEDVETGARGTHIVQSLRYDKPSFLRLLFSPRLLPD